VWCLDQLISRINITYNFFISNIHFSQTRGYF
jgi:hypothetical protein